VSFLIEELLAKMKNYLHRQIGFQELPKVNNGIIYWFPTLSSWAKRIKLF
jgi:hypothetical protein